MYISLVFVDDLVIVRGIGFVVLSRDNSRAIVRAVSGPDATLISGPRQNIQPSTKRPPLTILFALVFTHVELFPEASLTRQG